MALVNTESTTGTPGERTVVSSELNRTASTPAMQLSGFSQVAASGRCCTTRTQSMAQRKGARTQVQYLQYPVRLDGVAARHFDVFQDDTG